MIRCRFSDAPDCSECCESVCRCYQAEAEDYEGEAVECQTE